MAWRPTEYLIEGELDNTTPGKVAGWMRFAGIDEKVIFDLEGDFHRDIRGAKIHFTGDGSEDDPQAAGYMGGFATHQTGETGDITAGLPPYDYGRAIYIEWYGHENGRVVIELEPDQLKVIGRPIPACESDPISRAEQARKMAGFLAAISQTAGVVAIAPAQRLISDPAFTHWVAVDDQIIGEAHSIEAAENGRSFAFVRLFGMPESAEYGFIETAHLRRKGDE
ncbi:MAG: hypothetical protein KA354_24165 [Phycisphaerae bacterium]|nr:hypothetical protein [Phycisphaerae bacterium]